MNPIRVYIASPYSVGNKVENVRRSLEIADKLIEAGMFPYSPLLNHYQNELFPQPEETWIKQDLAWISCCQYLLRLPGESVGADGEVSEAESLGIKVFYDIEDLFFYVAVTTLPPLGIYEEQAAIDEKKHVALLQKVVDRLNAKFSELYIDEGLSANYRDLILETKLEE